MSKMSYDTWAQNLLILFGSIFFCVIHFEAKNISLNPQHKRRKKIFRKHDNLLNIKFLDVTEPGNPLYELRIAKLNLFLKFYVT